MVKFDFNGLRQENNNVARELTIYVNNQLYNEGLNYSNVRQIRFENTFGYIILQGFFNISNIDLYHCLTLDDMSVKFTPQIQQCCTYQFTEPTIIICFFLNERYEKLLNENQNILINLNGDIVGDNRKILEIKLNSFSNINIQQLIEKEEQRKIHERTNFIQDEKIILDNDQSISNNFGGNIINTNRIQENVNFRFMDKDDNLSNQNIQNLNYNNREKEYNFNFNNPKQNSKFFHFDETNINTFNINDKIENDEEMNDDINQVDEFQINNDFISFDDTKNFHLCEKINEIVDKNNLNDIEKKEDKSVRRNISINGNCLITVKKNDIINLKEEQLLPNNDLDIRNDEYKHSTITKYISLYEEILNNKKINSNNIDNLKKSNESNMIIDDSNQNINENKINKMTVNDYTILIFRYISELENKKIQLINELNSNNDNNNKLLLNNFIYRLEREISVLKLFSILFLNCFYSIDVSNNMENINSENKNVQKIRRKKLTEWLIETQKKNYNLKKEKMKNSHFHDKIILALKNGQIIDSIKECKLNNMPMLGLLISQMNNKTKTDNFKQTLLTVSGKIIFNEKIDKIFLLLGQSSENQSDIFIKDCNWYNLLIQICIFSVEEKNDIPFLINVLGGIINDNLQKYKEISPFMDNNSEIYDLNYLLLKIYSCISSEEIDNNELNDLIKILSFSRNLINNNSCDHHVQYIISSILLDIIKIIYPTTYKQIRINNLKLLTFDLFKKNIEELSLDIKKVNSNFKYIIKLINISNFNQKIKKKLIEEIITTININKPNELFGENNILNQLDNLALGYYYKNNFDYQNSYKHFEAANEFILSVESYILMCLNKLIYNKEEFRPNEIYNVLKNLQNRSSNFEGFNIIFFRYIFCLVENNNANSKYIVNTINQILNIWNNGKLITFAKGIMVDDLRKLLNEKLKKESNRDLYLFPSACKVLINDNDMQLNTKINEVKKCLDSIIEFKNLVFSKND